MRLLRSTFRLESTYSNMFVGVGSRFTDSKIAINAVKKLNSIDRAFTNEAKPIPIMAWFAILVIILHLKMMLWFTHPIQETNVKIPLSVEITILPVPLKQSMVDPVKLKPIIIPKKKRLPPKSTSKPVPIKIKKLKPAVQNSSVTKPLAQTPLPETLAFKAPVVPIAQTTVVTTNKPVINSQLTNPAKDSIKPSSDSVSDTYVEANYRANYGYNPKPKYPTSARNRHLEGKVLLKVRVSADGYSEKVTVEKSSGYENLDAAAVEAVQKWKFIPARRGNTPVASSVTVPINFKLQE